MSIVHKEAIVPYSADKIFNLVADVKSYPEFLPWCESVVILSNEGQALQAKLLLSKGRLRKSFTTLNINDSEKSHIKISLVEGPFKSLTGLWRFKALGDNGCKIILDMQFEFNGIMKIGLGPVFNQISNTLVDSFVIRANKIYG